MTPIPSQSNERNATILDASGKLAAEFFAGDVLIEIG
jgi:hypothetical protein